MIGNIFDDFATIEGLPKSNRQLVAIKKLMEGRGSLRILTNDDRIHFKRVFSLYHLTRTPLGAITNLLQLRPNSMPLEKIQNSYYATASAKDAVLFLMGAARVVSTATQALIEQQNRWLPVIARSINEVTTSEYKKENDWAWYVWPTSQPGLHDEFKTTVMNIQDADAVLQEEERRVEEIQQFSTDFETAKFTESYDTAPRSKPSTSRPPRRTLNRSNADVKSPELFPVIQSSGSWTLNNATGSYEYDEATHSLTTTMTLDNDQLPRAKMEVVVANVAAKGSGFKIHREKTLSSAGIQTVQGDIMTDIQMPVDRQRMFVLPSQLNAAEYYTNDLNAQQLTQYSLTDYLRDNTGGPRGQLSVDLGVAQFIIDNAHNDTTKTKGINNVRHMGNIDGIDLKNGYLHVDNPDVEAFSDALPNMTVLGIRNIPVRGLAFGDDTTDIPFVVHNHTVDLVYASAVPYGKYNNEKNDAVRKIAQMTLYGQYLASLRLAIQAGSRDVFLMPLGGGDFQNEAEDIRNAMISAVETVGTQLQEKDIHLYVLMYVERQPF